MWKLTLNPLTSLNIEVTRQVTSSRAHYINTHSHQMKVSFRQLPKSWNSRIYERETNLIIGGFLVDLPQSPLIVCFSFSGLSSSH